MPGDFHNIDFDIRIYHTFVGKKSPKKCMLCNESEKAMKRCQVLSTPLLCLLLKPKHHCYVYYGVTQRPLCLPSALPGMANSGRAVQRVRRQGWPRALRYFMPLYLTIGKLYSLQWLTPVSLVPTKGYPAVWIRRMWAIRGHLALYG